MSVDAVSAAQMRNLRQFHAAKILRALAEALRIRFPAQPLSAVPAATIGITVLLRFLRTFLNGSGRARNTDAASATRNEVVRIRIAPQSSSALRGNARGRLFTPSVRVRGNRVRGGLYVRVGPPSIPRLNSAGCPCSLSKLRNGQGLCAGSMLSAFARGPRRPGRPYGRTRRIVHQRRVLSEAMRCQHEEVGGTVSATSCPDIPRPDREGPSR